MLFSDRRSGIVHDVGTTAPPDQDTSQSLQGWAGAQASARSGFAASQVPAPGAPTRTDAWAPGTMSSQTAQPGQSGMTPAQKRPMKGMTGWAAQPLAMGASYAQKISRRMT